MQTATSNSSPEPLRISVAPYHQVTHPLVTATARHGSFDLETVGEWVMQDDANHQKGVPDSRTYLVYALSFLMGIATRQQRYADVCLQQKAREEDSLKRMEEVLPMMTNIGLDISDLNSHAEVMRFQIQQLSDTAAAHEGNAAQVNIVIARLDERIANAFFSTATGTNMRQN
ncbi:MAG: hypothetical protein IAF58_09810 [Leptolyngbya sp.]|nr:hypothetical protein [Candidatus Melainabacteria bacterium]